MQPITALQSEYSLWTRDPDERGLPVLRELGIGFVPYSPLGHAFLTGPIRSVSDLADSDWRLTNPRFTGENLVTRSLDPTGTGRARWATRWKPVINAFAVTFGDRFPAAETY